MSRPSAPNRHRRFWAGVTVGAVLVGAGAGAVLSKWPDAQATTTAPATTAPAETTTTDVTGTTVAPGPRLLQVDGPAGVDGLPPTTRTEPTTAIDNRVFVLGDSVMQGAAPYLGDDLPTWSITADTKVGRFLDEGVQVLKHRSSAIGQVAVILMGNNYNGDEAAFADQLHAAMEQLRDVRHVIFLTVTMYEDDRAEVNTELERLPATYPNVTVVDWGGWCDEHVDEFLVGDRLHLNPDGAQALASLVAEAVTRVTRAAGEKPQPGRVAPSLNTAGSIPSNGTAPKRHRTSTTSPRTTVGDGTDGSVSGADTGADGSGTGTGTGTGSGSGSGSGGGTGGHTTTTHDGVSPPTTSSGATTSPPATTPGG